MFLERNVASDDELIVAWVDGEARSVSAARRTRSWRRTRPSWPPVEQNLEEGGTVRTDSAVGDLLVTIQPVQGSLSSGALVVVTFLDDAQKGLNGLIRTYAITALLSLIVITGLAAWQAGRLLAPLGASRTPPRRSAPPTSLVASRRRGTTTSPR